MVVYEKTPDHHNGTLSHKVKERYIYGSNRVGTYTKEEEMIGASTTNTTFSHPLGARHYELTNHLGNVLAVVSDAPIKADTNADHFRDYHLPTLLSTQDYYPFGSIMRERSFGRYRYGFGSFEKDDEIKGSGNSYTSTFRQYDPRLVRWFSPDPKEHDVRLIGWSPYHYGFNNPIKYNDTEGDIPWDQVVKYTKVTSQQGNRIHPIHKTLKYHGGMDLAAATGSDVRSMAGGTIAKIGWDPNGYGRYVVVKHPNGYYTLYGHLEKNSVDGKVGNAVENGQVIGKSGNTGGSTGPHLHLEVIKADNLSGVFKKANKLDPETIGDLEEVVNPGSTKEAAAPATSWLDKPLFGAGWYSVSARDIWNNMFGSSNATPQYTPRSYSYTISTQNDPLRFYSTSSGTSNDLGAIPKGTTVTGTGVTEGGRTQVTYGGNTGWVSSEYIQQQ